MTKENNVKCGDVFYMAKSVGATPHLWVVLTEPDENGEVAMVNITTLRANSDTAVIIRSNEYYRTTHDSAVHFQDARIVEQENILKAIKGGVCQKCNPCSPALIKKIQEGITKSKLTPQKVIKFYLSNKSNKNNSN